MKGHQWVLVVGLACLPAAPAAGSDSGSAATVGGEVTVSSAYIWRGFVDIDGPSLQPSVWLSFGSATVTSWFSLPTAGFSGMPVREHDLTLEYRMSAGRYAVDTGWTNYLFHTTSEGTRQSNELFVRLEREGVLRPSLEAAHDVGLGSGTYVMGALESDVQVSQKVSLTSHVGLAYNHHQWIDESRLTHVEAGVDANLTVRGRVAVRPFLTYTRSLARSVVPGGTSAGVTISVE